MKILVTGASGVIGSELVPRLVADGHDVSALARTADAAARLAVGGTRPVRADLFDRNDVATVVNGVDAVINLATAIPPLGKMGRRRAWAMNDRLRTEAVANLVDASIGAGVERFVQPTITFVYADGADEWLDESAPVEPPAAATESALDAETSTIRFDSHGGAGVVLRLGRLYGPGVASAEYTAMLRTTGGVVVGDGSNFVPSLHVQDAATALVVALEVESGVYNVTDDSPARNGELVAAQVAAVGGRGPRRLGRGVARLIMGDAVSLMTVSQRVSNRRFREATGWRPAYPDAISGAVSLV